MNEAELGEPRARRVLPTVGSCPGQFTANTMAMVAETLGLAPSRGRPCYLRSIPSIDKLWHGAPGDRHRSPDCRRTATTRPGHSQVSENAAATVAATGGSTNAGLHLPRSPMKRASASRSTISLRRSPAHSTPSRPATRRGLSCRRRSTGAGGTDAVLKALLDGGSSARRFPARFGQHYQPSHLAHQAAALTARWCDRPRGL